MENKLQIFSSEQFGEIRSIVIDGEIWFVGKDVAQALGYKRERDAIKDHVDDEDKLTRQITASGQRREMTLINESGLYSLVFLSQLESAKKFKRWITSEVLPSIRKTGGYRTNQESVTTAPLKISDIAQDVVSTAKILEEYLGLKQGIAFVHSLTLAEKNYNVDLDAVKQLAPPAEHNTGYMNATQLGEKIGRTGRQTNKWLADNGYQFKDGRDWRLTEKGRQYAEEFPYSRNGHNGYQIRWSEPAVELLLEEFVH